MSQASTSTAPLPAITGRVARRLSPITRETMFGTTSPTKGTIPTVTITSAVTTDTTNSPSRVTAGRYERLWVAGGAAALAWLGADRFAILSLGDEIATGLGLPAAAVMRLGLVVVAVVSALVVTTVGMVPFVGLVVPNIVSRLMGDNLRASLPVTALGGAALLLACDILGRLVIFPYEVPVGSILGVIGAALFLWLLWRAPRNA